MPHCRHKCREILGNVGNGYPHAPYKLGSNAVCLHRFMNYRLRLFDGKWLVEHSSIFREWKQNQSFIDQVVLTVF